MTELSETVNDVLALLQKWNAMAVERRIPHLRAVKVAQTLCKRVLLDVNFENRFRRIFNLLHDIPDIAWPRVKVHWIEFADGTKWIYFCDADTNPKCDKCQRRIDCLTA